MNIFGNISVFPTLPAAVSRLQDLAYNLWWSWNPDAQILYSAIDEDLWRRVNQNPVKFLRRVRQQQLEEAAQNPDYLDRYQAVLAEFDEYMAADADTWFRRNFPERQEERIAYFSAEFGLHEALPIYSGGLGILSGDHCKEASDMGLPLIGVGFLYPQGYFTQRINPEGRQEALYEKIDFAEVPATPALAPDGTPVEVHVDLPGRTVYAKVWKIQVGRVPLFLMDTDVERNAPQDRELSARLYGGDHEMRISQEFVLGIGGVRTLRALGHQPTVWHMNEGHSAFLGLERIRELVQQGIGFDTAVEAVRAGNVFTTHTPVPAGHDAFNFELVEKFFWQYWGQLGIDRDRFLNLARHQQEWGPQFSMTVLAFRLSAYHNGVSQLHGHVSRRMWQELWPGTPVEQVPIGHITNGVHTGTWLTKELRDLYSDYFADGWLDRVDEPDVWQAIAEVPDEELWTAHCTRKEKMVGFVRDRLRAQLLRHGEGPRQLARIDGVLDPNALTLGFARRFATYKRATLLFRDRERLRRILNDLDRPVQIVFAGKAHPADEPGKSLIEEIYRMGQEPEFFGKIVFIENYDMNVARHLISGVDVWLNNPRRPYEASGTSGQKAAMSGAPNFSVLDGWWREAYESGPDGSNGWPIGEEREYKNTDTQDEADALSLYATLEDEIVPLYYERSMAGMPDGWLAKMRNSIATCGPQFSMRRMLVDYTRSLYVPAMNTSQAQRQEEFAPARQLADWKRQVRQAWQGVRVAVVESPSSSAAVGEDVSLLAQVWPGQLNLDDLAVEVVLGQRNAQGILITPRALPMQMEGQNADGSARFQGAFTPDDTGKLAFGVRVRPNHPALIHPLEMGLSTWA